MFGKVVVQNILYPSNVDEAVALPYSLCLLSVCVCVCLDDLLHCNVGFHMLSRYPLSTIIYSAVVAGHVLDLTKSCNLQTENVLLGGCLPHILVSACTCYNIVIGKDPSISKRFSFCASWNKVD